MTCPHITSTTREYNVCGLSLYGGKPSHGTCARCIERGENTATYAQELKDRAARSHPTGRARISGCCDSAKNYTDRI